MLLADRFLNTTIIIDGYKITLTYPRDSCSFVRAIQFPSSSPSTSSEKSEKSEFASFIGSLMVEGSMLAY